jgi:hypothetical protein
MKMESEHPVSIIPQVQDRSHIDLVAGIQVLIPGIVAIVVVVSYLVQVLETGNTDSQLGASLPIIVAAYFVVHAGTMKRNGV